MVQVDEQVVSVVPLTLPAGGSAEVTTRIPGGVLATHPGPTLDVTAEFRPAR